MRKKGKLAILIILGVAFLLAGVSNIYSDKSISNTSVNKKEIIEEIDTNYNTKVQLKNVKTVNHGNPYFSKEEITSESFEKYSDLDSLKRCGVATACIGKDTMPTDERGKIGIIKPSGWHTVKYPGIIEGNYLFNRCHLIAYCLAGENANEKNLITGTRFLNNNLMLPYELQVARYLNNNPKNHVMYRVTPEFKDNELVARSVLMEAFSVEDNGKGVKFCVRLKNAQPGIEIDYQTGESSER